MVFIAPRACRLAPHLNPLALPSRIGAPIELAARLYAGARSCSLSPGAAQFAPDSPVEGDGFKLPVPHQVVSGFRASLALREGGVPARFSAPRASAPGRVVPRSRVAIRVEHHFDGVAR